MDQSGRDLQNSSYRALLTSEYSFTPYSRQVNSSGTSFTVGDSCRYSPRSFAASANLSSLFKIFRLFDFSLSCKTTGRVATS